jgi:hypothetical protein
MMISGTTDSERGIKCYPNLAYLPCQVLPVIALRYGRWAGGGPRVMTGPESEHEQRQIHGTVLVPSAGLGQRLRASAWRSSHAVPQDGSTSRRVRFARSVSDPAINARAPAPAMPPPSRMRTHHIGQRLTTGSAEPPDIHAC